MHRTAPFPNRPVLTEFSEKIQPFTKAYFCFIIFFLEINIERKILIHNPNHNLESKGNNFFIYIGLQPKTILLN